MPKQTVPQKVTALFSIERVVALLTPFAFAPLSAWIIGTVARHAPGLAAHMTVDDLTALEVSGFLGACALAWKWLNGRQNPAMLAIGKTLSPILTQASKLGILKHVEEIVAAEFDKLTGTHVLGTAITGTEVKSLAEVKPAPVLFNDAAPPSQATPEADPAPFTAPAPASGAAPPA